MAEKSLKTTYFAKKPTICPICEANFFKEELLTGRGRMIAGDLTIELRRNYEPSKKFGEIFPLIYPVMVCPSCFYAAYTVDFLKVPEKVKDVLEKETEKRISSSQAVFDDLAFGDPRRLLEGAASYYFAIMCYDYFPKEFSPTFKQGLCSLRGAWVCNDLHRKGPSENWDYLASQMYRKARFFYSMAMEKEQSGEEQIAAAGSLGPDLDNNYGYDGVIYISGLLEYRYGAQKDKVTRIEKLDAAKRGVARIFGMGKASKNKPAAILDKSRDLYEMLAKELEELGAEVNDDDIVED